MKNPMVLFLVSAVMLLSIFSLPARADIAIDPSWYKVRQNERHNSQQPWFQPAKSPDKTADQANKFDIKEKQTNSSSVASDVDKSKNEKNKHATKKATSRKTVKKPASEKLSTNKLSTNKSVEVKSAVEKNAAKTSEASD